MILKYPRRTKPISAHWIRLQPDFQNLKREKILNFCSLK